MNLKQALILAFVCAASEAKAVNVTPEELTAKNLWVQQHLLTATNLPPFSFVYHGLASSNLLGSWTRRSSDTSLDSHRTQHTVTWTNAGINLSVRCVAIEYDEFPVVEWTVYLKNIGAVNTPVVQNLQGLDLSFTRTNGPEFLLHGNQGDFTTADSYQPFRFTLAPGITKSFAPPGTGKSSDGPNGWPYYNLQMPGGGTIIAIGWPGQWASSFARDAGSNLRIQAGQELVSTYLKPGEEIRSPLITLLFWQGTDLVRAQNLWRRFYRAHITPQPVQPLASVGGDTMAVVSSYFAAGITPDALWQDAGWYPCSEGPYTGNLSWLNTGTWEPDPARYPNGFKPATDQLHAAGVKFILWCEPERVGNTNSWLGANHPEWLLQPGSVGLILNEGNPSAFNWLTNHFDNLIKSNGVDWYREDMNGDGPCPSWRYNEAANRQGITENFYVQNHLAFWDALVAMNPGLRIDSCASGGRRNDLETMRRAVPLLRSDFQFANMSNVVDGNQCHTYALSSWLPFQGSGPYILDLYSVRSFYLPGFIVPYGITPDNQALQQQAYAECKRIAPIMLHGDFYPLTAYSLSNTVWMAWQFNRPDTSEGCVQVFRRANSLAASLQFALQGLDSNRVYEVKDFDRGNLGWHSGAELMSTGLVVQLNPSQSAVITYSLAQGVTVSATANPSAGITPLPVQFTAQATAMNGSPVTYAWNFGDGSTSTNQNPTHTYLTGGKISARVTATDLLGNTNDAEVPLTILGASSRRMRISFAGYSKPETLTNFPALVIFGSGLAPNGFYYGQMASSNGWDLLFMNEDGTQLLNHEIEKWTTSGNSYVWVQVPQFTSNTVIWAYWGDTNLISLPAQSLTNGSVWSNGYADVWHFANGTVLSGASAIIDGHDAAIHGASATGGTIDGAAWCNGSSAWLDAGTQANPMLNQQLTISAWVYPAGGSVLLMKGDDATSQSYGLEWSAGASLLFTLADTTDWLSDGGATPANQWSQVTGIIAGNSKLIYVNGTLKASDSFTGTIVPSAISLWLGAQNRAGYNYWYNGGLDEVRLSSVARSPNWIWAEYQSAAANTTFNSYGPVEYFIPPPSAVALGIQANSSGFTLAWPTNAAPGVILQVSQDLLAWTNATDLIVVSGTNRTVTIAPQNTRQFYRLAR